MCAIFRPQGWNSTAKFRCFPSALLPTPTISISHVALVSMVVCHSALVGQPAVIELRTDKHEAPL